MANDANRTRTFEQIAREHMEFETLETRDSDRLDFQTVAVWEVKNALEAAFHAGQDDIRDLLAAVEALLVAKDSQMETPAEWRRLRKAVKAARKNA